MIQVEGQLGDIFLRTSTGTRAWSQAVSMLRKAERTGTWEKVKPPVHLADGGKSIAEALDEFLADCESVQGKHLSPATLIKYKTVLNRLVSHCTDCGYTTFGQVNFGVLQAFKRTWKTAPHATLNNIQRLRAFWSFAVKSKYARDNPAQELELPKNFASAERLPYTEDEMDRILKAARTTELDVQQQVTNAELEAFILVQRYAGLSISDAALLQKSELKNDEIRYHRKKMVRTAKKQLVIVPLPPVVVEKLRNLPLQQERYFFCHGSDVLANAVEGWRMRLQKLFKEAKIENGGSHRFRHTFATSLLTKGVPLELVSRWLGHASVKTTEKHYSHFLENRIQAASNVLRNIYKSAGTQSGMDTANN